MRAFVGRPFLEAAEAALPLYSGGGPGKSSSPLPSLAGFLNRGNRGARCSPSAQPAPGESPGLVSRRTALQNGRRGSPGHCRPKPISIAWRKGEVGLRKKPPAPPRWLFGARPLTIYSTKRALSSQRHIWTPFIPSALPSSGWRQGRILTAPQNVSACLRVGS